MERQREPQGDAEIVTPGSSFLLLLVLREKVKRLQLSEWRSVEQGLWRVGPHTCEDEVLPSWCQWLRSSQGGSSKVEHCQWGWFQECHKKAGTRPSASSIKGHCWGCADGNNKWSKSMSCSLSAFPSSSIASISRTCRKPAGRWEMWFAECHSLSKQGQEGWAQS